MTHYFVYWLMKKHFFILFYSIESHAYLLLVCSFLHAAPLTVCPESPLTSVGPLFPFHSFLLLLAVKVSQHWNLAHWQCVKACEWLQSHCYALLAWWLSKPDYFKMLTAWPQLACGPCLLIVCLTSHFCDSAKISSCSCSLLPVTFLQELHGGAMP